MLDFIGSEIVLRMTFKGTLFSFPHKINLVLLLRDFILDNNKKINKQQDFET